MRTGLHSSTQGAGGPYNGGCAASALLRSGFELATVGFGVSLGGFRGVFGGVKHVGVSDMGVVGGSLMVARFVVRSSLAMMPSSMFVMFGSLFVMFDGILGHGLTPWVR